RIFSNDPLNPVTMVELNGIAQLAYHVTPPVMSLEFSKEAIGSVPTPVIGQPAPVSSKEKNDTSVHIVPSIALAKPLSQPTCDNTNIALDLTQAASNRYVLSARALPSLPHVRTSFTLTVRTADSNDP